MSTRRVNKPRTPRPEGSSVRRELTLDEARQVAGVREEVLAGLPRLRTEARSVFDGIEAADATLDQAMCLLRAERKRQGISFTDLAERTGMPRSALSKLENQEGANPTLTTVCRIAAALGVDLAIRLVRREESVAAT